MRNRICEWNWKKKLLILINIVFIVVYILVTIYAQKEVDHLYSQQEAQRWEVKKGSYEQVSAFISPEEAMQTEGVENIRNSLMQKLSQDALLETKNNARVWIDAYSGESEIEVRKDSNTISVTTLGVGGDFFQFHPLPLLSGSYISDQDLNNDRIVIDQGTAWVLFGSNDVVGMQVWIQNTVYVVAGVVASEEDDLSKIAYGKENRIYIPYESLKKHQENVYVTCYEAVLPNPISNYAYNALKEACGLQEEEEDVFEENENNTLNFSSIEVIENSSRYEEWNLLTGLNQLKFRSMRTNSIKYPYWENVARTVEEQQMILLVIRLLLLLVPLISLVVWISYLWIHKTWTVKGVFLWMIEMIKEELRENKPEEGQSMDSESEKELKDEENPEVAEEIFIEQEQATEEITDLELQDVLCVDWGEDEESSGSVYDQ